MLSIRAGLACLIALFGASLPSAAQTPPPPPPSQQQPPQEPTTTVVGADGRMVSLIFLRADAENVTRRIYDALLDREPSAQEHDESVAELQRGRLPQQLAVIVQTSEFTARVGGLAVGEVLNQIFRGMLDRAPTAAETKTYLPQVQAKQYVPAMLKLVTSDSFRKQVAQDRALSGTAAATKPATPSPAVPERPGAKPGMTAPNPAPATAPPATSVAVPPPPPVPVVPTGSATEPPGVPDPARAPDPARPPPRPAPFPTARDSPVSVPPATRPALTPEWTQILDCQANVVEQLRSNPPRHVQVRFDAPEISASTVRGTATDMLDDGRRLKYTCTGGGATFAYFDGRPRRASADTDFSNDAVKACHVAVISTLKRDRRGGPVSFETAGMMPTDSVLFVRGAGEDASNPGQPQPFTYQCQWNGAAIVGATFTLVSR
jgi:hypothetical protein